MGKLNLDSELKLKRMKGFLDVLEEKMQARRLCTGYRPGKLAINFSDCLSKGIETLKTFILAVSASKYSQEIK